MDYRDLLLKKAKLNPLASSGYSRRQVLAGLGAGAAAAGASALFPHEARAQQRTLNLLTWEAYMDSRMLDGFRKRYGTEAKAEAHVSDPTTINRLRAGETRVWDFICVNNPWARETLWPEKLIIDLPRDRFEPYFEKMAEKFRPPYRWAMSVDEKHLLGVVQRYDTFEFVVNTDAISVANAEDQGWDLFNDASMAGRYGLLAYDNWNVIHICMGAGVHPFKPKSEDDIAKFKETARRWISGAKLISTDFVQLNQAMLNGEIDAHITGGTYTASGARLDGQSQLRAITPLRGPADGHGGINWIELNSAVNNPNLHPHIMDFLEYILEPESSYIAATAGALQAVAQMAQPEVLAKFSKEQLDAMQYDSLQQRVARCVEFDVVPEYDRLLDIYGAAMRERA